VALLKFKRKRMPSSPMQNVALLRSTARIQTKLIKLATLGQPWQLAVLESLLDRMLTRLKKLRREKTSQYSMRLRSLFVVALVLASGCASPTSPSAVSGFLGASPATTGFGEASVSGSPAPMPPSLTSPACPVTDEDTHHARRLLRILTGELQRGITLRFDMEEVPYTSPRELHGFLNVGTAGELQLLTSVSLEKNALKFGNPEAAGYALWNAAGELTITADIYVNGIKVQGCTVRTGKITGRIDLDGL